MNPLFAPRRSLAPALVLAILLGLAPLALPTPARASPGPAVAPAASGVVHAAPMANWRSVVMNRGRMIQIAVLGMALAIFVLTRGHSKY
jgi:hypothetical protein